MTERPVITTGSLRSVRRRVLLAALGRLPACSHVGGIGRACIQCEVDAIETALDNLEVPG
jgi:hypothetical protein